MKGHAKVIDALNFRTNYRCCSLIRTLLAVFALMFPLAAPASEVGVVLRFENHHFTPERLVVPAGQPLALSVINVSKETIEFESFTLNREKAISPGGTITVHLPALRAGSYDFYDDFHQDVPEGAIVAQ
jgi:hypothetical protein